MFASPNFLLVHCGVSLFCVSSSFHLLLHPKFGFFQHLLCLQWVSSLGRGKGTITRSHNLLLPLLPHPPSLPHSLILSAHLCCLPLAQQFLMDSNEAVRDGDTALNLCFRELCCQTLLLLVYSHLYLLLMDLVQRRSEAEETGVMSDTLSPLPSPPPPPPLSRPPARGSQVGRCPTSE